MSARRSPSFVRSLGALALAASLLGAVGCAAPAAVRPWQRERLVDPIMAFKAQGRKDARRVKALEAREGSTGGIGGEGGGCACK